MEIRLATLHDAEACNEFFNQTYHLGRTLSQWQWEFLPRDFPADSLPYVVITDKGKIVGTQAFIPIRMIDERGMFWTVKSEESLVDPEYRGQKLFEKMYRVMFGYLEQHGIHCIWGFTPATKAFERIGFDVSNTTSQLFFPYAGQAVMAVLEKHTSVGQQGIVGKIKMLGYSAAGRAASIRASFRKNIYTRIYSDRLSGIEIRPLDSVPLQAGELTERFIRTYGGMTIYRDTNYLKWRLFDNPYVKTVMLGAFTQGQLAGWLAYAVGNDGMGYIVDLIAAPPTQANHPASCIAARLIAAALDELKRAGALGVRAWHVNEHPFDSMILIEAKRLGFYHIKRGHTVVLYSNPESGRGKTIEQFHRWFVTRIYTEGVMG